MRGSANRAGLRRVTRIQLISQTDFTSLDAAAIARGNPPSRRTQLRRARPRRTLPVLLASLLTAGASAGLAAGFGLLAGGCENPTSQADKNVAKQVEDAQAKEAA